MKLGLREIALGAALSVACAPMRSPEIAQMVVANRGALGVIKPQLQDAPPKIEDKSNDTVKEPAFIELNDQNFDTEIGKSGITIVVITSNECFHMASQMELCEEAKHALQSYRAEHPFIRLGKVDEAGNPNVIKKYGITSTPTVMVFSDGKMVGGFSGLPPSPAQIFEILDRCLPGVKDLKFAKNDL